MMFPDMLRTWKRPQGTPTGVLASQHEALLTLVSAPQTQRFHEIPLSGMTMVKLGPGT